MMEKHIEITPFSFCGNNPITKLDNNGSDYELIVEGNTVYIYAIYVTQTCALPRSSCG